MGQFQVKLLRLLSGHLLLQDCDLRPESRLVYQIEHDCMQQR